MKEKVLRETLGQETDLYSLRPLSFRTPLTFGDASRVGISSFTLPRMTPAL